MTSPAYDLRLRPATDADFDPLTRMLERAFGEDFPAGMAERERHVFEAERNLLFTDGDTIVANTGAFTRDLTVPGGFVPAAHVTAVGVHPTYRRRGLLTRLIHAQLRSVREAGREPIAVLWASEGRIYQRFGYGLAATRLAVDADRQDVRFLPRVARGGGRLLELPLEEARKHLVELYERVRPTRPGWSSRTGPWWDFVLADPPDERRGATPRYALLYESADGMDGYALWRTKMSHEPGAQGMTIVREVVAATPEAYAELWRFLLSVDLTRRTEYWCGAPDEPLLYLVDEPRALGTRYSDALWVRIVDLPTALCARRYLGAFDVVFEVTDPVLPENAGRWRLRVAGTEVTCTPTAEPAELVCDITDLGAAYLGGAALTTLAAAGRVQELRPGTLASASLAFGWIRPPSATEVF